MIKAGNNILSGLKVGNTVIKAVYANSVKIYPAGVSIDSGTVYGEWVYSGPSRVRTVTNWTQEIYQDGTRGPVVNIPAPDQVETAAISYRYGAWTYSSDNTSRQRSRTLVYTFTDTIRDGATDTVKENATITTDWDNSTYWNGACGSNYYYVDYKKVRSKYTFTDVIKYSDYRNGDSRSRRIEGSCGWVRDWREVSAWANNGQTCNINGVTNGYNCDGTYTVKYYQQARVLAYCFPDMSGETQRKTEYRAGAQHSRLQVDGCCGYVARINNRLTIENVELIVVEDDTGISQEWEFEVKAQYPVDQDVWVSFTAGGPNQTESFKIPSGQTTVVCRVVYGYPNNISSVTPSQTNKYIFIY